VVIGPNAKVSTFCGGGSSALAPYYAITPYDGIVSKTNCKEVPFTVGAYSHKELPLLGPSLRTADGQIGVSFSAYLEPPTVGNSRERVDYKIVKKTDMFMFDYVCPKDTKGIWYADIEGSLTPDMDGDFELGLCVYGTAKLYVDGNLIIDNESKQRQGTVFFGNGTLEEIGEISVKKGQTYHLKVEYASAATNKLGGGGVIRFGGGGVRIGGAYKIDPMEEISRAVELAKKADQVVVCAGLNVSYVLILLLHHPLSFDKAKLLYLLRRIGKVKAMIVKTCCSQGISTRLYLESQRATLTQPLSSKQEVQWKCRG